MNTRELFRKEGIDEVVLESVENGTAGRRLFNVKGRRVNTIEFCEHLRHSFPALKNINSSTLQSRVNAILRDKGQITRQRVKDNEILKQARQAKAKRVRFFADGSTVVEF